MVDKRRLNNVQLDGPLEKIPRPSIDADSVLLSLDADDVEPLDEFGIKKLILQFEKRVLANQELRIKFADNPERFMDSELDLHVSIQEMHAIATMPTLYHLLTDLNAVETMMQLLMHDNTDISIAVVNLLLELTDVDTLTESDEGANTLIEALIGGLVLSLLVQNMERLDESVKDESDGVQKSLGVVENLVEFKPEVSASAPACGLLSWLLKRVRSRSPFDGNKLYASEILAILVQNSDEVKRAIGDIDGIDILLGQLAHYKRHDPTSTSEVEYMENLFNCLCACLLFSANRIKFLKGEGLQLMNLMLRERKRSRASALRVLNHATSGDEGKENCDKFVEILGLRTLFPLFMKTPTKDKRKGYSAQDHEEHVISILASLLRNCDTRQRLRIMNKFAEQGCAKVERLIEMHLKYLEKVNKFERKYAEQNRASTDYDEDDLYLQKLDAGLFTLQLIDFLIAELADSGSSEVREKILKVLKLRGGSTKSIKNILREYATNLGDDKVEEEGKEGAQKSHRRRVEELIEKM